MNLRTSLVTDSDVGLRMDLFLARKNNDLTRTQIKKEIQNNNVTVNGELNYHANYSTKLNDIISINISEVDDLERVEPQNIKLNIIYEDDDLVVVNKEAGMPVHPSTGHTNDTLLNALIYRYSSIKEVGDKKRSGLIHRLDKDTSGLILVAKTNKALWHYTKQFANRHVEKTYVAICYGQVPKRFKINSKITVQNFIGRSPGQRKKMTELKNGGKFAHSEIYYLGSINEFSLFKVNIMTGRTHQIRVHLSGLGLPILGDLKYGRKSKAKRLMLHSWKLKINNLNNKVMNFTAPIPNDFIRIFDKSYYK